MQKRLILSALLAWAVSSTFCQLAGQTTAPPVLKTEGEVPTPKALYSPDHDWFVAWMDVNTPAPIGPVCPVVFRSSTDWADIFSVVVPQYGTKIAAWNVAGNACLITDQPDNGNVFAWLVSRSDPGHAWAGRKLDFLAPVYAAYRRAVSERGTPLFRPYLEKVEWLSDTRLRFLVWSNLGSPELASAGRYFVTVDLEHPDAAPTMVKISESWVVINWVLLSREIL